MITAFYLHQFTNYTHTECRVVFLACRVDLLVLRSSQHEVYQWNQAYTAKDGYQFS